MKRIFISSPLRGDVETNIANAIKYCELIISEGNIPYAPHVYFPQFMSVDNPEQDAIAIQEGLQWLWRCDELHIFGDELTEGMKIEIDKAVEWDKKIVEREI